LSRLVDTFCSAEAFSSGQKSEKSLTPSWWGGAHCPCPRTPPCLSIEPRPSAFRASCGTQVAALWAMPRLPRLQKQTCVKCS